MQVNPAQSANAVSALAVQRPQVEREQADVRTEQAERQRPTDVERAAAQVSQPEPQQAPAARNELRQAVEAAQQNNEVQLNVRRDENEALTLNVVRANGEQRLPYQAGSVLDTRA
ncbi:hypothetical protein ACTSKR_14775 [Chitinibacteraceae bacterium HSL-7]